MEDVMDNGIVIIIGAGVSGLSAAYMLHKKDPNLKIMILEAKDRVGGRTVGQSLNAAGGTTDMWDLGGQWIGRTQTHVLKLMEELGLEKMDQFSTGAKVVQIATDKVSTYRGMIPTLPVFALIDLHLFMLKVDRMARLVPRENPALCPFAEEWDSITAEYVANKYLWTRAAKEVIRCVMRTVFGCELSQMSSLYMLHYINSAGGLEPIISAEPGGGQEYKIQGGAFQISQILADKVGKQRLHLNQPVLKISQTDHDVTVYTIPGQEFKCHRLIMAIPPHQAGQIQYEPALPMYKSDVFHRMAPGCITKIIVTYEKPFWKEKGLSGEIVTSGGPSEDQGCDSGPLCIAFDATTINGNPALVSFIGGKQHVQYTQIPASERKQAVLRSFAQCLGEEAMNPVDYAEKNWSHEPYNAGGPGSVGTPGMMLQFAPGLRKPFNRIHFAGTESATWWCGFINGAVQSGQRAAIEVLHNIKPDLVTPDELKGTAYDRDVSWAVHPPKKSSKGRVLCCLAIGLGGVCVILALSRRVLLRAVVKRAMERVGV